MLNTAANARGTRRVMQNIDFRLRLVSLILLVIVMSTGYRAEAADTPQGPVYLVPTGEERDYARQDNNRVRVNKIEEKVQEAAIEAGREFGPPRSTVNPNVRAEEPQGGNWLFQQVLGFVSDFVTKILRWLFDILAAHALALVHNPNVSSPYDKDLIIGTNEHAKYDLLTLPLKKAVTKGFVVMRAVAINLLLLLFILTIWKYFIEAAWKNAQELMGVVARLIATAALIVFWPVISYHYVQISNEMIDYVFRSISFNDLALALDTASRAASGGAILYVFGTAFSFGVGAILGKFLAFFFFFPAIYQLVHLIVLKAIQTAIMLAQYMFAPMFLIFMATPDTEKIAIGFIKSCLEVSLWTFAWAGLFRLAVMILAYAPRDYFWGTFIMLLGIFQIMLQVPDFIAHAQIGHSSALLTPLAALRGAEALMSSLKGGVAKFRDFWNGKGRDEPNTDAGNLTGAFSRRNALAASGDGID